MEDTETAIASVIHVCSFQGLQNLPLVVAQHQGYFKASNLEVILSYTNSSAQQLASLARGEYDLIHTAPDNVVNFDTRPESFGCARESAPHVVLLMGGSNGPLSIYAQPHISSPSNLRACQVGVDNPSSGFALVLRDLLAHAGLELDEEYTFIQAGGTGKRVSGLLAGTFAATILYPPFDRVAARAGCYRLARSTDVYPAYASQALAGVSSWVEAHSALVTRYISALLAALRWIYTPTSREAVETLLATESQFGLDGLPPSEAYAAFVDPRAGFGRDAMLDEQGLRQVIELRARYAPSTALSPNPANYCDLRWYLQARASISR